MRERFIILVIWVNRTEQSDLASSFILPLLLLFSDLDQEFIPRSPSIYFFPRPFWFTSFFFKCFGILVARFSRFSSLTNAL